ncbi:TPA: KilA-N domain-containing protein [Providencia stuartii]|uniref:KilA-N domain-containing protein n=1 Tax=Providencia stuartii TaxID=588 RepID=UPI0018C7FE91|nr:KilA-N domain-containing protein [Providencia stuartii]MBG5911061.1 KilA-N domain-containing protein [Providencia stuartii]MBG5917696.1 KilA-N domain-containing protein [Providencia stuartii]HEM6851958.1 KilA-N domain-containing protein [Providencia stuartii]HEM8169857.1 KilA-N domain-containing protein [Providencia stuartii]HEM8191925.1 KilA-N domain-containing protein [Providencia stuartii]
MNKLNVIVNGVSVRVDNEGRYSLNDLHTAAVLKGEATESQKPSKFVRSASVKRFISALDARGQKSPLKENQSLKVIKGGNEQGVWAAELLAIRYAAWIKPEFEISVYEIFREATLNVISNMNKLNRLDLQINNEKQELSYCGKRMNSWGVGGRKKMLESARQNLIAQMDPDLVTMMEASD